jgi:TatA/E family protein of Tat protein translocase
MEIVVVAIIALLVLGPARLPGAAKAVGKGMREFKTALSDDGDDRDEPERPAVEHTPSQSQSHTQT